MRPMISDAQGGILRAIRQFFEKDNALADDPAMVVEMVTSENWASVTFIGQRHFLELSCKGGDTRRIDELVHALSVAELVIPGHIVVDIAMISHEMHDGDPPQHRLCLEALTVAD